MNYKNIRWGRVGIVLAFVIVPIVSFSIWGIVYGTEKIEPTPTPVSDTVTKKEARENRIKSCFAEVYGIYDAVPYDAFTYGSETIYITPQQNNTCTSLADSQPYTDLEGNPL